MTDHRLKIEIEGMSCAGCASKITSALQRDQRVESAVIDYATRSGLVEGAISREEIGKIINSVGYKLLETQGEEETAGKRPEEGLMSPEMARMIPAFLLAAPVVITAMGPWHVPYGDILQLILTTLFFIGPASGFFIRAFKQLTHGFVTMDTLVTIGMGSAWIVSVFMVQQSSHHLYFESAVMIGFFVLLGKALEDSARRKSIGDVDRLVKLRPRTLWKIDDGKAPQEIPLSEAKVGDFIYLRPGDMLALDGVITEGEASFDESVITGESVPVIRGHGDSVPSGAVNAGATGLTLKVTRIGKDTTVEQIIQLIEDARLSRPPIQKFADKISSVFVPVVIIIAVITWILWWFLGGLDFNESLMRGLSVLVVACPCALGLATPVAWVAGLGRAARAGVLVRSYDALETLRKANAIIFDKTGTLTYGKPTVLRIIETGSLPISEAMGLTLSALSHSSHPLSRAIASWIKEKYQSINPPLSKLIEERAGQGVTCEIKTDGKPIISYGRPDFVVNTPAAEWSDANLSGNPVVAVAINGKPLLLFELKDALRSDVNEALAKIKESGMEIHIASGDKDAVVANLAKDLVGVSSFRGSMTPVAKKELVDSLRKSGKIVAFVGDGINDAPALAAADVGISLGTGTDVAAHSAGLVLQKTGLTPLIDAIKLSDRITTIIRENFFWAFFYNIAAIPVAVAGYVTPMWAAAAMAMSSVSVVTNALRLRR
jgi:Cu+-exporting ATPase